MPLPQNIWKDENLIKTLKNNGVVIMPTDTIYGLAGKALNKEAVSRIYEIRKRNPNKPCIILIGDIHELEKFSIFLSAEQKNVIENFSIPTSFILNCPDEKFTYLHRGTNTLAFRIPKQEELRNLLRQTGPLIAPSANLEARPPSENIQEAKKYFGDSVDLYINGGEIISKASKLIQLHKDGNVTILRA
jgi:L-threonylcarbamoyladenylate synthase